MTYISNISYTSKSIPSICPFDLISFKDHRGHFENMIIINVTESFYSPDYLFVIGKYQNKIFKQYVHKSNIIKHAKLTSYNILRMESFSFKPSIGDFVLTFMGKLALVENIVDLTLHNVNVIEYESFCKTRKLSTFLKVVREISLNYLSD